VSAWRQLPSVKLKIVGDGALRSELESRARRNGLNIEFTGMQDRATVLRAIANAKLLIIPSEWYEGFPMVIAESFACGTPVLASRIGSLDELVEEGVTGKKFTPGNKDELAAGVLSMLNDEPALQRMRANARAYFDAELTEQQNFARLMSVYSDVIGETDIHKKRKHA
jgi:glycosyltransferase involved in cell wall biosynthesis